MSINVKKAAVSSCASSVGSNPGVLPEVRNEGMDLQSWVSTSRVQKKSPPTHTHDSSPPGMMAPRWHVLRTTYGQEKKAFDYMQARGVKVFLPTERIVRLVKGKRRQLEKSLVPNMFFAFGTEDELKAFVFDNVNLPFLRFYYNFYHEGKVRKKIPLTVPSSQMRSFQIICEADSSDAIVSVRPIPRFLRGERARVTSGRFAGVEGRVVRYKGQQRVGMVIDGLLSVATAYIPEAFLQRIDDDEV